MQFSSKIDEIASYSQTVEVTIRYSFDKNKINEKNVFTLLLASHSAGSETQTKLQCLENACENYLIQYVETKNTTLNLIEIFELSKKIKTIKTKKHHFQ